MSDRDKLCTGVIHNSLYPYWDTLAVEMEEACCICLHKKKNCHKVSWKRKKNEKSKIKVSSVMKYIFSRFDVAFPKTFLNN